jgi:hypothetical protein
MAKQCPLITQFLKLFGVRTHIKHANSIRLGLRNPSAGVPQAEMILPISRSAGRHLPQDNACGIPQPDDAQRRDIRMATPAAALPSPIV